ncbi:MAG: hypothetical protein NC250_03625 [Alistipes senegalensis]|nr:hypothetical protein [Bacteroides cellulosilyticus]MCM1351807.1 hypothetical protein [Alistipes senegalensis]
MQFTRIPDSYAPLGGPLVYAVEHGARSNFAVRILNGTQTELYGAKRFADVAAAEFDIAPYLRRTLRFTPVSGKTGVYAGAPRIVGTVVVAAADAATATSAYRVFLPATEPVSAPALLTSMPRVRLIPVGASDELSLLTDGPHRVTLIAEYGPDAIADTYDIPSGGLHIFLLNTANYRRADKITIDAGTCGKVVYSLVQPMRGSVRLAWRSRAGSLEHYTFPVEATAGVEAAKQHAYGPDGYVGRATGEYRRKLRSALEMRDVLEALAELVDTPEVWMVGESGYVPVEVVSERAVVHNHGTMSYLEVTIREAKRREAAWN